MNNTPPFDFNAAVQFNDPEGYPFVIDSRDLMKNFVYATAIVNQAAPNGTENLLKASGTVGLGGHSAREFYVVNPIPPPPQGPGVYLLGIREAGELEWFSTEECDTATPAP